MSAIMQDRQTDRQTAGPAIKPRLRMGLRASPGSRPLSPLPLTPARLPGWDVRLGRESTAMDGFPSFLSGAGSPFPAFSHSESSSLRY